LFVLMEQTWRVTMADTDAAGIIYYASPLRWMELTLGGWLEQLGHPISSMLAGNEAIPVVGTEVRYQSPLGLDDQCRLRLSAQRIGTTTFTVRCDVIGPRAERPAVVVVVTHAYGRFEMPRPGISAKIETRPLPSWLREALEADSKNPDPGPGAGSESRPDPEDER
jgi:YbgC/YbaW family acyl-CoA thioester hydrolase